MPASSFTFFQDFKEQLGKGIHDLATHDIKIVLAAAANAPNAATYDELADVTQIGNGGGYTGGAGGGIALSGESYTEAAGTGTFTHTDPFVITAAGGSIGPFRYLIYYNNTSTNDKLIGYLDYGSDITLADTETVAIDLPAGGLFTVA